MFAPSTLFFQRCVQPITFVPSTLLSNFAPSLWSPQLGHLEFLRINSSQNTLKTKIHSTLITKHYIYSLNQFSISLILYHFNSFTLPPHIVANTQEKIINESRSLFSNSKVIKPLYKWAGGKRWLFLNSATLVTMWRHVRSRLILWE